MTVAPWWVRSQPLNQRSGSDIFAALYSTAQTAVLLESPSHINSPISRYSICGGPPRNHHGQLRQWTPTVGQVLSTLKQFPRMAPPLKGNGAAEASKLPFAGGWLGWLGYDVAWEIEKLPFLRQDPLPFPVAFWYEPASFAVLDHRSQQLWLAASAPSDLDSMEACLTTAPPPPPDVALGRAPFNLGMSQSAYEAAVLRAKHHIRHGDIFQANLSLRFEVQTDADGWALYRRLQCINPSPFANYWRTPWGEVVSCSPERLVQLCDRKAKTRPIAGTRPRGQTPHQDQQMADTLRSHPKEIAEHIMLVDLERNDLGRVCALGSIQVDELLVLEYYSHVIHLVSNVVGDLAPNQDGIDLLLSVFPGGTITGCPKVRCMEIIETLEPVRRSLFYGSCGYLDCRGNLDLNILIRTLLIAPTETGQTIWGQVGAGIVADSQPDREWWESLQKAKAQLLALGLTLDAKAPVA